MNKLLKLLVFELFSCLSWPSCTPLPKTVKTRQNAPGSQIIIKILFALFMLAFLFLLFFFLTLTHNTSHSNLLEPCNLYII